ncbi:MAG: transcriptional regulator [Acidobacteriota bacterium]
MRRTFDGGRPRTTLRLTPAGRAAFSKHMEILRAFLGTSD